MSKGKHLVFFEADKDSPSGYYTDLPVFITGGAASIRATNRGAKEDATWFTQKQAKRLIDKCRGAGMKCRAEPSFTVVY